MNPRFEKTHLQDVVLISSDSFSDERGVFMEAFVDHEMSRGRPDRMPFFGESWVNYQYATMGIFINFPQDNFARSGEGVLRGLHIQRKEPQGKLVRCLKGRILDVVVDLRKYSPTFKKWGSFELNSESNKMLWVPPGFAHGYFSYDESVVYYKCSTLYDNESDGGIFALDPELGIKWPSNSFIMSDKDKKLPKLSEWLSEG